MKKKIYKWIFQGVMGWKITGTALEMDKCVMIVVPHTSWIDFFLGVFTRGIVEKDMNFVGKKELFFFPMKYFFKWMGGEPLNRKKNENKVETIANIFQEKEVFRLAIAPEGTRQKVTTWKTGFYYIAKKANVPIVPIAFDYAKKEVKFFEPFYVTDDFEKDLSFLQNLYKDVKGRNISKSFEPTQEGLGK